jgi:hypothetical protein
VPPASYQGREIGHGMRDVAELIARLQARGTETRMIGGGIVVRKIVEGPVFEGGLQIENRRYAHVIDAMMARITEELS